MRRLCRKVLRTVGAMALVASAAFTFTFTNVRFPGRTSTSRAGRPLPGQNVCGVPRPGFDISGNDVGEKQGAMTAAECCQLCASTKGCVAAIWGLEPREGCYLKESLCTLHPADPSLVLLNLTNHPPTARARPVAAGGVCGVPCPGFDISGNDVGEKQGAMTAAECCQLCASTKGCVAAIWGREGCYLKESLCTLHPADPSLVLLKLTNPLPTTPVQRCRTQACEGHWAACTRACEAEGTRKWTTIQRASLGGSSCPTVSPVCHHGDGSCGSQVRRHILELNARLPMWGDTNLTYLVAVLSARGNHRRRQASRDTWIKAFRRESVRADIPSRVIFVVGSAINESTVDAALHSEQRKYHDLFFVDTEDSYMTSAHKMLGFYRQLWLGFGAGCADKKVLRMVWEMDDRVNATRTHIHGKSCRKPYFALVKLDDDAGILPTAVPTMAAQTFKRPLQPSWPRWQSVFRPGHGVFRHKMIWTISKSDWPHHIYPAFASGPGHIMNLAFAEWLGKSAPRLPTTVWFEDVAHGIWFDMSAAEAAPLSRRADQQSCRLFDARFPIFAEACVASAITTGAVIVAGDSRSLVDAFNQQLRAYQLIAQGKANNTISLPGSTSPAVWATYATCKRTRVPKQNQQDKSFSNSDQIAANIVQHLQTRADTLESMLGRNDAFKCPAWLCQYRHVSQGDVDKARQTSVMAAGFLAEYLAPPTKRFVDLLEALPAQLTPQRQTLPDPIELCGPSGNMSLTIHVGKEAATERVTLPLDSIFWVEE
jgi:hypothetical protein